MKEYIVSIDGLVTRLISEMQNVPALQALLHESKDALMSSTDLDDESTPPPQRNKRLRSYMEEEQRRHIVRPMAVKYLSDVIDTRLLWATSTDASPGELLCKAFGFEDVPDDASPQVEIYNALEQIGDDELLEAADLLLEPIGLVEPGWLVVDFQPARGESVRISIEGDFRILEWNKTNAKMLKRRGLWGLSKPGL